MVIVGKMNWAISKLWELVTSANQWTQMMENVLDMVTINSDGNSETPFTLQYLQHFPFYVRETTLPSDSIGYVYLLIS